MRKMKEVLRLQALGLKQEQIARSCGISQSTVSEYQAAAAAAGINWDQMADWNEVRIQQELFPNRKAAVRGPANTAPDFTAIHQQLQKHKHVTLQLLWEEYRQSSPDGYRYSRFCELYQRWRGRQDVVMRQQHRAGEKLFVDFAGDTVPVYVEGSEEPRRASIFVAVLGASSYTYAEATWTQGLEDWIAAHVRTFEFLGGVPEIVVPDNTRAAVNKSCRYDPELNRTYQDLAAHYGVAVVPARPAKPRDKAKVEAGVLLVERWILAALRHRKFHSLAELNAAIAELLTRLNDRPFRKREGSRRSLFEALDKAALQALPVERYDFSLWRTARVNIDYHVEFERHYYSVPYQVTGETVELRATAATLEIFHQGTRIIASHARSGLPYQATTVAAHRPKSHQRHLEWTPSRLVEWAQTVGPFTAELFDKIMAAKPHPEMGFRSCLGILRLGSVYSPERVETAARRAVKWKACSYQSIKSMLERGLDQVADEMPAPSSPPAQHPNIRGPEYFGTGTSDPIQGEDLC